MLLMAAIIYVMYRLTRPTKQDFIDFVRQWEGGISRAKTDTASSDVAPGTNGIHTNKGIRWTTYYNKGKGHGYKPTVADFLKMSDERWLQIFNSCYWNPMQGDKLMLKDPALAFYVVQFAWGSGLGGAEKQLSKFQRQQMGVVDADITKTELAQNFLLDPTPFPILFQKLIDFKKQYYIKLNQPANLNGWNNRLNDFNEKFKPGGTESLLN